MASRMTKAQRADKDEAIKSLRSMLKPGQTIYTIVTNAARSGMSRSISLFIPCMSKDRDGRRMAIMSLDWYVCRALGYRRSERHGGLIVGGAGMDMGFHLVYNLGRVLWPQGTPKPHGTRNGTPDRDGGYALKHRWLG